MASKDEINRRDFLVTTAGAAGSASALTGAALTPAAAQTPSVPPPGFDDQEPIKRYWGQQLSEIVKVDLSKDAPELADSAVRERHRIYCFLLMKLIHRFWNGNKRGPFGTYPMRAKQREAAQQAPTRYRGDTIPNPEGSRINWDRYLGHNIACIAVDGNGEIIDFDFNHNDFFRSSAEHAESRMVRRLFSLTDIFDSWKTGRERDKSRAALLTDVTLYTSLESCAQCSGVMSLAQVKQIVYLQNDFTAYMIGNIMYNLANRNGSLPGAPTPIPASEVGIEQFKLLNDANLAFKKKLDEADRNDPNNQAFFVSPDGNFKDFSPSITSFLCTDTAHDIFDAGGKMLDTMRLEFPDQRFPNQVGQHNQMDILTNAQCLQEARAFYKYADIEGYRGSPHKL